MALFPGTRLGPYEVTAQIGVGGMGEVYRATDTNLKRAVAIKVLPASVASDAERLARFQREAEVLAALNHPNIAQIYGLEKSDGTIALVMELVEGSTLADRIAQGAIPFDDALPIARQIAEALEAAHEQGIIHRDLKPANIKVRGDGTVKVLDFGLAKLAQASGSGLQAPEEISQSPTITSPAHLRDGYGGQAMTQAGIILGTAAYMSPEQAKGRPVDKRADIWAFGCVLYEMLTGKRAFGGDDVADTIAAVLRGEPDWSALPASTSRECRRVLRRCLEKDVRLRLRDIGDARIDLTAAEEPIPSVSSSATRPVWAQRGSWLFAATAAAVAGTVVGVGMWATTRSRPDLVVRTNVAPPPEVTAIGPSPDNVDVTISADGRRIAYVAVQGATEQLYVRSLHELDASLILSGGANDIRAPALSPDGNWIAFVKESDSSLKRIPASGGPPMAVGPVVCCVRGIVWSGDDAIFFATTDSQTGILRVPAGGGTPDVLTTPKPGEDHYFPQVLPGGRRVLFTVVTLGRPEAAYTAVLDIDTREEKIVTRNGSTAHYAASGHLVDTLAGSLRAVPFDLGRLETRGTPVPVVNGVATKGNGAAGQFALSATGTLFYLRGGNQTAAQNTLVWVDRQGHEEPIDVPPRTYRYATLSPDGTRAALDIRDLQNDIWIWDFARQTLTPLTFDPGMNRNPVWFPDGKRVAFSAERDGSENLYWQAADGTGTPERLVESSTIQLPTSFSSDGKRLVFHTPANAPRDLGVVSLEGDRRTELLLNAPFDEQHGVISPDGHWLAYQSNESKQDQIYVRPFPNVNTGRWPVSTGGGTRPLWSRDGRELFYYVAPGRVMAVPIQPGTSFSFGRPQVLFEGQYVAVGSANLTYDVSPDGKRFLMIKAAISAQATSSQLVVVQNFFDELKRLVPTN